MGGSIEIEQKGWESVIYDHDCDLLVTKVRCRDLLISNQGEFRCWHAVDLFSLDLGWVRLWKFCLTRYVHNGPFNEWNDLGILRLNFLIKAIKLGTNAGLDVLLNISPRFYCNCGKFFWTNFSCFPILDMNDHLQHSHVCKFSQINFTPWPFRLKGYCHCLRLSVCSWEQILWRLPSAKGCYTAQMPNVLLSNTPRTYISLGLGLSFNGGFASLSMCTNYS